MPKLTGRPTKPAIIAAGLIAVLVLSGVGAEFYTDALWYADLGQAPVFWRTLFWRWGVGAAAAVVCFGLIFANLRIARAVVPVRPTRVVEVGPVRFDATIEWLRRGLERSSGQAAFVVAIVAAVVAGISAAGSWETVALALNRGSFGVADAQFGRDIGFFFFTLPALRSAQQ